MAVHPRHPGIYVRESIAADGHGRQTFTVRWSQPDGRKPRRTFDTLQDALDFQARRRSAKRWRPEELRQEQGGRRTLADFFEQWWREHALIELRRSTLEAYRIFWRRYAEPALGAYPMRDIDARRVVAFRAELLEAGVGRHSIVRTMSMLQGVFRDAVEYGEVAYNPFKAVRKPALGPAREARPFMPMQVEALAADMQARGYASSAVLVRVMGYTGLRPQEALALHWYAVGQRTLLVELANAGGELDRLKNRKRSRRRSRSVDLVEPVREDLSEWRMARGNPGEEELVFPHQRTGGLWGKDQYKAWQRRVYTTSARNTGAPSTRPYDLRHTWASLLIAEGRLSIVEVAEQLGDLTSTVLDTYSHVIHEWRGRENLDIETEIRRARAKIRGSDEHAGHPTHRGHLRAVPD